MKEAVKREIKVALSKEAQPMWFRITKWIVFIGLAFFLYGTKWFWAWVIGLPVAGLAMHFIYRWKTKGWTKSWGQWKTE